MNTDLKTVVFNLHPPRVKKGCRIIRKKALCILPVNQSAKRWSDRKTFFISSFSSYVFVFASTNDHAIIRQTDGVINFIHCR
jgi:hypothetical protein